MAADTPGIGVVVVVQRSCNSRALVLFPDLESVCHYMVMASIPKSDFEVPAAAAEAEAVVP